MPFSYTRRLSLNTIAAARSSVLREDAAPIGLAALRALPWPSLTAATAATERGFLNFTAFAGRR
jgi:hypothetical protein